MRLYLDKLKNYPIGVCGCALGFLILGNVYTEFQIVSIKILAIIFASIAILFMIIRVFYFPKVVALEIKNYIPSSFYTTIDMSLFLIATVIFKFSPIIGRGLWFFSAILHIAIIVIYSYYRIKNHKFSEIIPSWYVTYVGIVTGTITGMHLGFIGVSKYMLYFGILTYFLFYPFILYRIFNKSLNKQELLTIGIIAAPAALILAGMFAVYSYINPIFLGVLVVTMFINLIIAYYFGVKLFSEKFVAGLASFTFPLSISTLATFKFVGYLKNHVYPMVELFKVLGIIQIIITSIVILYVVINFIIMLYKNAK